MLNLKQDYLILFSQDYQSFIVVLFSLSYTAFILIVFEVYAFVVFQNNTLHDSYFNHTKSSKTLKPPLNGPVMKKNKKWV